jgi:hypothetical protein
MLWIPFSAICGILFKQVDDLDEKLSEPFETSLALKLPNSLNVARPSTNKNIHNIKISQKNLFDLILSNFLGKIDFKHFRNLTKKTLIARQSSFDLDPHYNMSRAE